MYTYIWFAWYPVHTNKGWVWWKNVEVWCYDYGPYYTKIEDEV